jgi:hypothetical protein
MAGTKKVVTQQVESAEAVENLILEQRKVKALEKIANSLDALTVWFEEIEKQDWSDRIQYYLYEFHNNVTRMADAAEGNSPSSTPAGRPKKDSER